MERIEKLPKWAQGEVRILERRIEELEKELAIRDGKADSPIYYKTGPRLEMIHRLPNEDIYFKLPGDKGNRDYSIEVGIDRTSGLLNVRGYDGLIVRPRAGNMVEIELEDR